MTNALALSALQLYDVCMSHPKESAERQANWATMSSKRMGTSSSALSFLHGGSIASAGLFDCCGEAVCRMSEEPLPAGVLPRHDLCVVAGSTCLRPKTNEMLLSVEERSPGPARAYAGTLAAAIASSHLPPLRCGCVLSTARAGLHPWRAHRLPLHQSGSLIEAPDWFCTPGLPRSCLASLLELLFEEDVECPPTGSHRQNTPGIATVVTSHQVLAGSPASASSEYC